MIAVLIETVFAAIAQLTFSTHFQRTFNALSTHFQRTFNALSTHFQRTFNALSTHFQRTFNAVVQYELPSIFCLPTGGFY
ncbi:hypothetical protein, partial [Collimonas sp.]|uniref:hypothetical protein n=1 Tax=Collimonas sp. TaxID=1963772 RepID=UPI0037C075DB